MGIRKYRGAVTTVREAADADRVVVVRCFACQHAQQMHAFTIARQLKEIDLAIDEPQPGFRCRVCRKEVEVVITCSLI